MRFSISSGDENRDFSISEDTGVIRVAKNLNFERKSRYILTVRAEDSSNDDNENVRHDTATISISVGDINDNPPTFLDSPYLAYVMENVVSPPNGYVLTVRASDADTPQYNGQVRYFLKEGDAGLFRINASTGDISLLRALDREMQSEYLLTIVAMDTGEFNSDGIEKGGTGVHRDILRGRLCYTFRVLTIFDENPEPDSALVFLLVRFEKCLSYKNNNKKRCKSLTKETMICLNTKLV